MHPFTNFVTKYIPYDWKPTSNGWISGNCPMCTLVGETRPDTKKRGGIYIENDTISYHCFNCNFKAYWNPEIKISKSIRFLLETFGAEKHEIQKFILFNNDIDYNYQIVSKKKYRDFLYSWKEIPLPPKSKNLFDIDIKFNSNEYNCLEYIFNRNLDFTNDWWYSDYKITYTNRIILPLRYNKKIVGYTARLIKKSDTLPKYLTNKPNNYVFNLDNQYNSKKTIIVTEGYFDALMVDGVAIGSNYLNDIQAEIIESYNKDIILIPDANKAGKRLALSAIDRGWSVSYPPWEKGITDVSDAVQKYGRLFTVYSIIEFAERNPVKSKIIAQKWCN
jgi:hypothetical protein